MSNKIIFIIFYINLFFCSALSMDENNLKKIKFDSAQNSYREENVTLNSADFKEELTTGRNIIFNNVTINYLFDISNKKIEKIILNDQIINGKILLNNATIYGNSKIQLIKVDIELSLEGINFIESSSLEVEMNDLPQTLNLSNIHKFNGKITIAQKNLNNYYENKRICKVRLDGCSDISFLQIDYIRFRLDFPNNIHKEERKRVYEMLLSKFKKEHLVESYENLDKEYKEFKYSSSNFILSFVNYLDKYWWDYGYKKELVVFWTFFFILLFTFIITASEKESKLSYEYLRDNIYEYHRELSYISVGKKMYSAFDPDKAFNDKHPSQARIFSALLYVLFIFFSLRLDFKELKPLRSSSLFIIVIYTIGNICLGFLIKVIITNGPGL